MQAQKEIADVKAVRDLKDQEVAALTAARDEIADKLGLKPGKLTEKYLDEQMETLRKKFTLAEIERLEDAMSAVNKAEYQANKLTETMGNIAARDYIRQMGGEVVTGLDDAATRSGTLDVVGIVGGKLVVVEAKGGGSQLGARWVTDDSGQLIRVQQGTPQYLKWMLDNDPVLVQALKDRGLLDAVRNGDMDVVYDMVRYDPKVGQPQWYRFNIEDEPVVPPGAIRKPRQPAQTGNGTTVSGPPQGAEIANPGPDLSPINPLAAWMDSAAQSMLSNLTTLTAVTVPFAGLATRLNGDSHGGATRISQSLTVNIAAPTRTIENNSDSEHYQALTYGSGILV